MTDHQQTEQADRWRRLSSAKRGIRIVRNFVPGLLLFSFIPGAAQDDDAAVHIVPVASFAAPAPQAHQPDASRQDTQSQNQPAAPDEQITLPPGTRLSLALVRSLSFKHTKPGDNVNLQFIFPVTAGQRMVIPPGTYLEGAIDQVMERDRAYELMSLKLRSADVIFATGYAVSIPGPLDVNPTYGKLSRRHVPKIPVQIPVMAATGDPTLPPLPPLPHLGPSMGEIIGIGLGVAAATATLGFVAYHNRDFLMETGTPMEITLSAPLVLDGNQVTEAVRQFANAPPQIVLPPRKMRTCWTASTPDFPSTPYPCPY